MNEGRESVFMFCVRSSLTKIVVQIVTLILLTLDIFHVVVKVVSFSGTSVGFKDPLEQLVQACFTQIFHYDSSGIEWHIFIGLQFLLLINFGMNVMLWIGVSEGNLKKCMMWLWYTILVALLTLLATIAFLTLHLLIVKGFEETNGAGIFIFIAELVFKGFSINVVTFLIFEIESLTENMEQPLIDNWEE